VTGPTPTIIVRDEKERERLIRALGFGVVRYTWADAIGRPGLLLHRVVEAKRLRQHAPVPTDWRLDPPWTDLGGRNTVPKLLADPPD